MPVICPGRVDIIFVVAPACSSAFFGSVNSTCSKSSVATIATRIPLSRLPCMRNLLLSFRHYKREDVTLMVSGISLKLLLRCTISSFIDGKDEYYLLILLHINYTIRMGVSSQKLYQSKEGVVTDM